MTCSYRVRNNKSSEENKVMSKMKCRMKWINQRKDKYQYNRRWRRTLRIEIRNDNGPKKLLQPKENE